MADDNHTLQELSDLFREQQEQFAADMDNANETGTLLFTLIKHFQDKSEGLRADMMQLRDALETLASTKPVGPHGFEPNTSEGKEVMARIDHARAALNESEQGASEGVAIGKPGNTRHGNPDEQKENDEPDIGARLVWLLQKIEAAGWPELQGGKRQVWETVSGAHRALIAQKAEIGQLRQETEKLRPFKSAIEHLTAADDPNGDSDDG